MTDEELSCVHSDVDNATILVPIQLKLNMLMHTHVIYILFNPHVTAFVSSL